MSASTSLLQARCTGFCVLSDSMNSARLTFYARVSRSLDQIASVQFKILNRHEHVLFLKQP